MEPREHRAARRIRLAALRGRHDPDRCLAFGGGGIGRHGMARHDLRGDRSRGPASAAFCGPDTDPLSIGGDVAYNTLVLSVAAARRINRNLTLGVALRSRNGQLDDVNRTGISFDVGLQADHLTSRDIRIGAPRPFSSVPAREAARQRAISSPPTSGSPAATARARRAPGVSRSSRRRGSFDRALSLRRAGGGASSRRAVARS